MAWLIFLSNVKRVVKFVYKDYYNQIEDNPDFSKTQLFNSVYIAWFKKYPPRTSGQNYNFDLMREKDIESAYLCIFYILLTMLGKPIYSVMNIEETMRNDIDKVVEHYGYNSDTKFWSTD